MKFSAQEEYGLRCLLAIARTPPGVSMTIPRIAESEQLSEPHVAKLLMILRKAGFVKSTRGHTGGYALAMSPDRIVLGDVLCVLGGKLYAAGFCDRHSGLAAKCVHEYDCSLQFLWTEIQEAVDRIVYRMTLADLLERRPAPVNIGRLRAIPTHPLAAMGRKNGF